MKRNRFLIYWLTEIKSDSVLYGREKKKAFVQYPYGRPGDSFRIRESWHVCMKPFFNFYETHFFRDFLSSSLNLFISRSFRSLHALPVKSTCLSSERNAWLRIPAIVYQSAGDFGFLAATSVASMISFEVVGHLKGAIFYKIKSNKGYAVFKA